MLELLYEIVWKFINFIENSHIYNYICNLEFFTSMEKNFRNFLEELILKIIDLL